MIFEKADSVTVRGLFEAIRYSGEDYLRYGSLVLGKFNENCQ